MNSLNIEKEAFPLLEKLHILGCPQLKEVPSSFQHLRNLKELNIADMPTEFDKSLDPKQRSHYCIIQHVPSILLCHKVRKGVVSLAHNDSPFIWLVSIILLQVEFGASELLGKQKN